MITKQLAFNLTDQTPLQLDFQKLMRVIPAKKTDFASHNLHPFPAKFLPQYPEVFVHHFTYENETVLDPMCGAGTTNIQASLMRRYSIGVEIDPIGRLIAKVATTPIAPEIMDRLFRQLSQELKQAFQRKRYEALPLPTEQDFPNALLWFTESTLRQLTLIRSIITQCEDADWRDFALLSLSAIVRAVSNADPRDIFPERDPAVPIRDVPPVLDTYLESLVANCRRLKEFTALTALQRWAGIYQADARDLSFIEPESIDLVFTSPPYCYAIDYARVHQLSTLLLLMTNQELRQLRKRYVGTDRVSKASTSQDGLMSIAAHLGPLSKDSIEMTFEKDSRSAAILAQYLIDMAKITKELFRVLKKKKRLVYVIGNSTIRKTTFRTADILAELCTIAGFDVETTFERPYYAYRMARNRNIQSNTIKSDIFIVVRRPG